MAGPLFTCEAKALAGALRSVREVVERTNTIVILGNVLIEADGAGNVRVTCSNLSIEATRVVAAQVREPGAITVPASRFTDVVGAMEDGAQVECDASGDGGKMLVKSGRSRFTFATLPAKDFPGMVFGASATTIEMPALTLNDALVTVRPAISTEETRYYLCGVFFHVREKKLRFAATDGHRLARVVIPMPDGAADLPDTIVSTAVIDLVKKNLPDGDANVRIEFSGAKVRFSIGDLVITAKAVEGTYPEYTRVIPPKPSQRIEVDRDALSKGLKRVLLANDDKTRSVKLSVTPSALAITSASSVVDGSEEVPCEAKIKGGEFVVGFNGRYLSDLLGVLDVDSVIFEADEPTAPTLITSPGRPDATLVLMPMRV